MGAQDYAPPPPLEDEHFGWMIGKWEGSTESKWINETNGVENELPRERWRS